jgi:hypothetical protein
MEELIAFDQYLFEIINGHTHNAVLDWLMPIWREKSTWIPFYLALAVFLGYKYRKAGLYLMLGLALSVGLADTISSKVIKPAVHRLRPCNDPEIKVSTTFGALWQWLQLHFIACCQSFCGGCFFEFNAGFALSAHSFAIAFVGGEHRVGTSVCWGTLSTGYFNGGIFRINYWQHCCKNVPSLFQTTIRHHVNLIARLKIGLFTLLFVCFFVRSAATHSKTSLNQGKNP